MNEFRGLMRAREDPMIQLVAIGDIDLPKHARAPAF
jgi:hypothetical protein